MLAILDVITCVSCGCGTGGVVGAFGISKPRDRIVMNSDQIDRNVEETEATNFYE